MRSHPLLEPCASPASQSSSTTRRSLSLDTKVLWVLPLLLACALSPRAARAEDDATTAAARERFKEGVQYFDQKQYDKSRSAFLQAYALKPHPAVLLNLGQAELLSGHEADAAKHFSLFLRESKDAAEAERQAAESGLANAKPSVQEIQLTVDEDGASVSVDGANEGVSPLPGALYLPPGPHILGARKEGREVTSSVTAAAGQSASVVLRFKPAPSAAPAPSPAQTPAPAPQATANAPATVVVNTAPTPTRHYQPFFHWLTHSPLGIGFTGVTVLGIAGTIAFPVAAQHSYDDADFVANKIRTATMQDGILARGVCINAERQQYHLPTDRDVSYANACKLYSDKVSEGDTFKKTWLPISAAALGVGVVGLVVSYVVTGKEPSANTAQRGLDIQVVPWVVGEQHGASLVGRF